MKIEIKVGLVGLAILVLLFFGIKFLKGHDLLNKENTYYVIYDSVNGMHESNYIYLNGMKIGYVKDIQPMDKRAEKFLVEISVNSNVELYKGSEIILFNADMLGSKALRLELGESKEVLPQGDTLKGKIEVGTMDKLVSNLEPIVQNVDSLLIAAKNILNTQTQKNLNSTFDQIEQTSKKLNIISSQVNTLIGQEKTKVSKIIENTESITSNLKNNNEKLTNIINHIDNISDTLAKAQLGNTIMETAQTIERLNSILGVIEKGNGNVGLLINDDKLYRNLEQTSKKLDALIEDIKNNPKRYINVSVF